MADPADLLARLTALEATVAELHSQLAQSPAGRVRAMRDSRRCPACGSGSLLHFREVYESAFSNQLEPLSLSHVRGFFTTAHNAPLEAFACRRCMLVEWHAKDFERVEIDGKKVVAIEPEPEPPADGPFR